jgi:NitT/TauT family transport system permease protein
MESAVALPAGAGVGLAAPESRLLARVAAQEAARARTRRTTVALGRALILLAGLGGWAYASGRLMDAEFVSSPRGVAEAFTTLVTSGRLFPHLGQTLGEVLAGYAIGVVLAVALTVVVAVAESAHRVLRPFLLAFYSIPKIALAPLIVMWFGLGTLPKVILAAAFVFFVVFMNMVTGVYTVNRPLTDALRVMGAGRRALLLKLVLPGTVPYLMTGLRLAVPEALIGAVVGEFIASSQGLGYLVTSAASQFNTAAVMAAILALLLIVVVMDFGLSVVERRLLRWRPRPALQALQR